MKKKGKTGYWEASELKNKQTARENRKFHNTQQCNDITLTITL